MKKILYLLIGTILLTLSACDFKEGELFDDSSAERMNKAIREYNEILSSHPNGWIMEYYAGKDATVDGGHCFIVSFKDGKATMVTDHVVKNKEIDGNAQVEVTYQPGDAVSSLFQLKYNQGPVLSFDTQNPLIHHFMEPTNTNIAGREGDFEFVMMDVKPDKVIMKGKKWGKKIVMTPLDKDKDWKEFMTEAVAIQNAMAPYTSYELYIDKKLSGMVNIDEKVFTYYNEGGEQAMNVTILNNSIKLNKSVNIGSADLEVFTWDAANKMFIADSNAGKLELRATTLAYEDYIGTYKFTHRGQITPKTFTISQKVAGESYTVSEEALGFEFVFYFVDGQLSLRPQMVGLYDGNRVWIEGVGDLFGGVEIRSKIPAAKMKTKWRRGTKNKPELSFVSDGKILFAPITYFALGEYTNDARESKVRVYSGGPSSFIDAVISKQ